MIVNKKGCIQQFDLVIYPVDFVAVIGDMEKEVNELYTPYNEEYNYIAKPKYTGATYNVKEKATDTPCVLVWVGKIEEFTSSIITHEVSHAAIEIFKYIGASVNLDEQEPFCYLTGNLARLLTGSFYDIPGIKPPVICKKPSKASKKNKTKKEKEK